MLDDQSHKQTATCSHSTSHHPVPAALFKGFSGAFCQAFQIMSLYWLCFRPGLSSLSSAIMASEYVAYAARARLIGAAQASILEC